MNYSLLSIKSSPSNQQCPDSNRGVQTQTTVCSGKSHDSTLSLNVIIINRIINHSTVHKHWFRVTCGSGNIGCFEFGGFLDAGELFPCSFDLLQTYRAFGQLILQTLIESKPPFSKWPLIHLIYRRINSSTQCKSVLNILPGQCSACFVASEDLFVFH